MGKLDRLTAEQKEKLKEYVESIHEIQKEISEMLAECGYKLKEANNSSGLVMPTENED